MQGRLLLRRLTRVAALATALVSVGCGSPVTVAPELDRASAIEEGHTALGVALERVRSRLFADPFAISSEAAHQATHEFLSGMLAAAFRLAGEARYVQSPRFSTAGDIVGRPGLFNPDNIYSSALLDPDGHYRIHGRRGSHTQFTLQFLDHYPLIDLGKDLFVIEFDAIGIAPGEAFELYFGGQRAPAGARFWPMPKGARSVLARQTFSDWQSETPSTLRIERLDQTGPLPDGPIQMELAADYLDRIARIWSEHYLAGLRQLPENVIPPRRDSADADGGLSGQQGVIARYRIGAQEALVVTVAASDAAYQGMQVGDYWFVTPDPVTYPSSLNRTQAAVDPDGYIRYVICERDPGVANWLATGGANQGYIMLRWQGLRTPLAADDPPRAEVVSLEALSASLPPTTLRVNANQREQALSLRRAIPTLKR